jgi:hypothetical protein
MDLIRGIGIYIPMVGMHTHFLLSRIIYGGMVVITLGTMPVMGEDITIPIILLTTVVDGITVIIPVIGQETYITATAGQRRTVQTEQTQVLPYRYTGQRFITIATQEELNTEQALANKITHRTLSPAGVLHQQE